MMHMARAHASRLLELSHLSGAEAPLPVSLSWGADNIGRKDKAGTDARAERDWGMEDKGIQVRR